MDKKQVTPCIFCGGDTEEQIMTGIGLIYIHADCLVDLEEILSIQPEEQEEEC
jgi:hypothetical protein